MQAVRWEELRRNARNIENEIDEKLNKFSRLGASFGVLKPPVPNKFNVLEEDINKQPVDFETIDKELSKLISNLTAVNNEMSDYVNGTYGNNTSTIAGPSSQQHTMKRHREILRDYSQDYSSMRNNIIQLKNKEDLLGSVYRDMAARESNINSSSNRSTTILLNEQKTHDDCSRLLDDHINSTRSVQAALRLQRDVFKAASQKVASLSHRFPLIAGIVNRINWRKRKETVILSFVIGSCLFVLLMYLFH